MYMNSLFIIQTTTITCTHSGPEVLATDKTLLSRVDNGISFENIRY